MFLNNIVHIWIQENIFVEIFCRYCGYKTNFIHSITRGSGMQSPPAAGGENLLRNEILFPTEISDFLKAVGGNKFGLGKIHL